MPSPLLVAMSWLLGAALAGLPYYAWAWIESTAPVDHAFGSFSACYFEAMRLRPRLRFLLGLTSSSVWDCNSA